MDSVERASWRLSRQLDSGAEGSELFKWCFLLGRWGDSAAAGEAEGYMTGHGTLCILILWGTWVEEVSRVLRNKILGIMVELVL